jgi:RNA polymerase sigma-70 factor (ECF subfamily)
VEASGSPAFAHYHPGPNGTYKAWGIIVLELSEDGIAEWNSFLDVEKLFPHFGLPLELPQDSAAGRG